ncbi:MAG TPA: hypothetical protein PL182_11290, partial [Pseudobdellovibrionaceae bacterium]|nr:hypothetical protein [Pseudobdellovibrionaceae bacterium]
PAKTAAKTAVKPAAKPAAVGKKAPPAPKKAEKATAVKAAPKKEDVRKKAEKPNLKLAPPIKDEAVEEIKAPLAKPASKKAEKTTAKTDVVKTEAPKSLKATLKLLKSDKGGDDSSHWQDLHDKFRSEKAQVYDMKNIFEAGKPLQHKVLGWGWVISNENDRLDVLFKDGRRTLISNYNPNR